MATRLSKPEIFWLVNEYIGVSGGYLGDFTYRTHREFYPMYCDLDLNPEEIEGTTRERFITILSNASGTAQAKIVRGVMARYPRGSSDSRTEDRYRRLLEFVNKLEEESVRDVDQGSGGQSDREKFRSNLSTLFNESELETLCFDLGIDYEGLKGQDKVAKAREIILFCERKEQLEALRKYCLRQRPHVNW